MSATTLALLTGLLVGATVGWSLGVAVCWWVAQRLLGLEAVEIRRHP